MKDVVTDYWVNYKMATIEMDELGVAEHALKSKFATVTIHDVTPAYESRIVRAAELLSKLEVPFGFAMIPLFRSNEKFDISNNQRWLGSILSYNQPVVLHGLYHEDVQGNIEDFHNFSYVAAVDHLRKGQAILSKSGITPGVFVPPTWAVNKYTIDALQQTGFSLVETDQEILLLRKNTRLHCSILNWDRGSPYFNALSLGLNRRKFRDKILNNSQMVRLAIHPKDDDRALADQSEMITSLKEMNYNFLDYTNLTRFFG
ncbi:MAG: DUF2334 domain-containing protein [Nitrososphaera sp.]|jgi:predicted deacetylase